MDVEAKETIDLEARREKHRRLLELAREQGVKPVENIENLYSKADTEDFDVDEFLEVVKEIRQSGNLNQRIDELTNGK
jgi:hypothetical protein